MVRPMSNSKRESTVKPEEILLGLATVPMLVGLVVGRTLATMMVKVGQSSEELFRGDRLPILRVTPPTDEQSGSTF